MGLLLALEFLTVFRLPWPRAAGQTAYARAQRWYAVVGVIVGAITLLLALLAGWLAGDAIAAAVAALTPLLLSRGLHLDGLADCADAVWGGYTPERRLEIMKDSRIGVFGALAIGCTLLFRWAAASTLIAGGAWYALALAPVLGRAIMPLVVVSFPYVRPRGLGERYREAGRLAAPLNLFVALLVAVLVAGAAGLAPAMAAALIALCAGLYLRARVGGLTGDGYGAAEELAEVTALVVAAILSHRGLLGRGVLP